uniref:PHD-type domain-containing protein n=1 Tax=Hucho hucho TaxID=62062 RepID=A0A4W5LNC9_9TELE
MQKKTPKADDTRTDCTSCKGPGDNENLVRCDECCLCYHFGCLDPPLKKSPKQTGYGWICQECDTSSSKVCVCVRVHLCTWLACIGTLGGGDDIFFWHHVIEAAVKQLNINLQQILQGDI